MDITTVKHIDGERFPLCPVCDQPIFVDALVIREPDWGAMCLAHRQCVEEIERPL